MPRLRMTPTVIERLRPAPDRQIEYFDLATPGLALRISPGGRRIWRLHLGKGARGTAGRLRRITIGTYPDVTLERARAQANAHRDTARNGAPAIVIVPARTPPPAPPPDPRGTFGELARLYLERHATRKKAPRSAAEDARMIAAYLHHWRERPAAAITRRDIHDRLAAIAEHGSDRPSTTAARARRLERRILELTRAGHTIAAAADQAGRELAPTGAPIAANRCAALISRIYTFAIDQGILEHSPAVRLEPPMPETARERVLTDDEIRIVWARAVADPAPQITSAFCLALCTAKRIGEILSMDYADLEHAGRHTWYTIPAARVKNRHTDRAYIPPTGRRILAALAAGAGQPAAGPVFPHAPATQAPDDPIGPLEKEHTAYRAAVARVFAGLAATPHDLRRTVATRLGAAGFLDPEIGLILNHARGITSIYNRHQYDERKIALLTHWDRTLATILRPPAPRKRHGRQERPPLDTVAPV